MSHTASMGNMRNAQNIFFQETQKEDMTWRFYRIGLWDVLCIHVTQDTDLCRFFYNMVMNLLFHEVCRIFDELNHS